MAFLNLCVAFKSGSVARLMTEASIAPDIILEWTRWLATEPLVARATKRVDNKTTGKPAYAFRIEEVVAMWQEDV